MQIINGTPVFEGIAIGKIRYFSGGEYRMRQYLVSNVKKETAAFGKAVYLVKEELIRLGSSTGSRNPGLSRSLQRQAALLEGESFPNAVMNLIVTQKISAAYAVALTRDDMKSTFGKLSDPVARRRIRDVSEVSDYLIEALGGVNEKIDLGEEPVILAADTLALTDLMEMDQDRLLAVITREGSEISHTAILTKTRGIPSMFGVTPSPDWDGMTAIVDSYAGMLYLNPDDEELKEYTLRKEEDDRERSLLLRLREEEDRTLDGKKIDLYANIGSLADLGSVEYYGAGGIGLLRSEFQYLGRDSYPGENELFQAYRSVAQAMGDKPVYIRTADLGAEKQAAYLGLPQESNPIMGNRGIRLSLAREQMFRSQLRAIYRASIYGNLALMYPMITSLDEVYEIEAQIREVKLDLTRKNIPYVDIPTGIMIETPAAVIMASELADRVSFISLGTNDLTQYTLAMDRQNPALRARYDSHHPAVMKMIRMVIWAAHQQGKRVTICGELAADTALTEEFLRMGVDALSVVPASILPIRRKIRSADLSRI